MRQTTDRPFRVLFGFLAFLLVTGCSPRSQPIGEPSLDAIAANGANAGASSSDESLAISSAGNSAQQSVPQLNQRGHTRFLARMKPQVGAFCGNCHPVPSPNSSSRSEWAQEVGGMYMVYKDSGRKDLVVPDQTEVLKYFQLQASQELPMPIKAWVCPESKDVWPTTSVRLAGSRPPAITNVRWLDLGDGASGGTDVAGDGTSGALVASGALVYCDIGSGMVKAHFPMRKDSPVVTLATLYQPVHVELCDLDADGNTDLLVADIGEFDANDSDLGRVVWLQKKPNEKGYFKRVIQDGLGRVADARPGDFDGDGDTDVLVAVFGWRNTGQLLLLRNVGTDDSGNPIFEKQTIDERHGPVSVVPCDMNQDGHLDVVVLFGQEHESVEAFTNDGHGHFTASVLWKAPTPAYGSSAIEVVDVDGDSDLDVIYSNGDTFDRGIKPHHSVQWLENQGEPTFVHHEIGKLPGAQCFCSGDFDQDGDIDIVVGNLIIGGKEPELQSAQVPSLVLYEQGANQAFQATSLEVGSYRHLAITSGDFDADGRIDLACGQFRRNESSEQPDLTIRWNRPEGQAKAKLEVD